MLSKTRNIIFDLGGVIINIDQSLTFKAFKEIDSSRVDLLLQQTARKLFIRYEKGLITTPGFIEQLNRLFPTMTQEQIIQCWNALLMDIPGERIDLLQQLQSRYNLYLLSNTNELHINAINQYLTTNYGLNDLRTFFIKTYYSFEVKLRKPEPEIFQFVLHDADLNPEETLFIDDTREHVETAKRLGIRAHLHDPAKSVVDLFQL